MILLSRIVLLFVMILLLVFCMSNLDPVTVKFLTWESLQLPFFLVVLFAFFFGFSIALFWQALRGLSTHKPARAKAIESPPVEKMEQPAKQKRGWGLKKKAKQPEAATANPPGTAPAADPEPAASATAESEPASEGEVDSK